MGSSAVPILEEKKAAVSKIELRAISICEQAKAVSYTHLDVYKRQMLCRNGGQNNEV